VVLVYAPRPAINIIERNPYAPRPFVFTEVAICLRDAIRAAGYQSDHLVNHLDPSSWSIVLGGTPSVMAELGEHDPARCAIFNFEQLESGSHLASDEYVRWLTQWKVIDYNARNIEVLAKASGARSWAMELPVVPSAGLVTARDTEPSVDVLFYGTPNARRETVLQALESLGLRVEVVAGAYAHELAPAVRRAHLVLHVHFYATGLFPVARMLQPAAMGVPIVCESSVFSPLNDWSESGIFLADYDQLADTCRRLLADRDRLQASTASVQAFCASLDFRTPLDRLLEAFLQPSARFSGAAATSRAAPEDLAPDDPLIEMEVLQADPLLVEAGLPKDLIPIVRREPGQGPLGRWMAWLLVAFILAGSLKYWLDWRV